MDVAALGMRVDSSEVVAGAHNLDVLTVSSAKTEAVIKRQEKATRDAAAAAVASARAHMAQASAALAAMRATQGATAAEIAAAKASRTTAIATFEAAKADLARVDSLQRVEQAHRSSIQAANANTRVLQHSAANTANVAAQLQDVAVSAQMGMNPLQIGLQQGTQLAAVMAMMDKPLKGLAQAFAAVLSPVALMTIGVIALVAALIQFVDWGKFAQAALNALADAMDYAAPYAVVLAGALTLLYSRAIIVGIMTLIGLMGSLAVSAIAAAASFTLAWLAALGPAGWFILGITAIVAASYFFRDEIQEIFGIDLFGDIKGTVNWLISAFVAGYTGITSVWNELPAAFKDIGTRAINGMIQVIESGINLILGKIKELYRLINPFARIADDLDVKIFGKSIMGPGTIGSTMFGTGAIPDKIDIPELHNNRAGAFDATWDKLVKGDFFDPEKMNRDWLGDLWKEIQEGSGAAADSVRKLAEWLGIVTQKKEKGKTEKERWEDLVGSANRKIADMQAEVDGYNLTAEAAAKLKFQTDLLNDAKQKNINLTPKMRAEIDALADTMARLEREEKTLDFFKGVTESNTKRINTLNAERDALGLSKEAAAKLRIETELLNDALSKNITLTGEQRARLSSVAAEMASVEVNTAKAKEQVEFVKEGFRSFLGDMFDGLKKGESFWDSFANAAIAALDRIQDKILDELVDAIFELGSGKNGQPSIFDKIMGAIFGGINQNVGNGAKGTDFISFGDLVGAGKADPGRNLAGSVGSWTSAMKVQGGGSAAAQTGATLAGSVGSWSSAMKVNEYGNDLAQNIRILSNNIGANAKDMATLMSFESGLRPNIWGGAGGRHYGLIQAGPTERAQYGITPGGSLAGQFKGIENYFEDRGFKPGMSGRQLYSTVNTGSPNTGNRSDAANGGTWGSANDKWDYQMDRHRAVADRLMGGGDKPDEAIDKMTTNSTLAADANKKLADSSTQAASAVSQTVEATGKLTETMSQSASIIAQSVQAFGKGGAQGAGLPSLLGNLLGMGGGMFTQGGFGLGAAGFGGMRVSGFAKGGFTGEGDPREIAGVTHKREVVFSEEDIKKNGGIDRVERIRKGGLPGFAEGGPTSDRKMYWNPIGKAYGAGRSAPLPLSGGNTQGSRSNVKPIIGGGNTQGTPHAFKVRSNIEIRVVDGDIRAAVRGQTVEIADERIAFYDQTQAPITALEAYAENNTRFK